MASAGLLLYRVRAGGLEVFLVHPGGPFWRGKDAHAWSIPKGEHGPDEQPLDAARRELEEETGVVASGPFLPLGEARQRSGKVVRAWACAGDTDPAAIRSNTFTLELPKGSGRMVDFPEVDKAAWFPLDLAREKVHHGQEKLLDAFAAALRAGRIQEASSRLPDDQQ